METCSIVIVGVGGQGVLFLSEVLGQAAMESGLDVKVAEIHGMAQRGGSVISTVRLGKKVHSPTVAEGEANLIIALEPIEALRSLAYAHSGTTILVSTNPISPPGLSISNEKYPELESIVESLGRVSKNILTVDTLSLARKSGSLATQNTVMLGLVSASGKIPLGVSTIKKAIADSAQKKFQEVNLKAFDLGFETYKTLRTIPST